MKTSRTFSLLFWVNSSRIKDNTAQIYVRITVNGRRASISLKRRVNLLDWDASKGRAKGKTQRIRMLNNYLDEVHTNLFNCYQELKQERKLITSQAIKARYLGDDDQSHTVLDIVNYHNEDMGVKLKWGTQKNYFTTQRYIEKFLKKQYKTSNLYLHELDYNFIIQFERYLRSYIPQDHQRKMGNNTVMKHIDRLKKLINLAYKLNWITQDPFANFKSKYIRTERGFLNQTELERIENKTFHIDRLELVKDLFIFSCYTSLSYIDVINLREANINMGIDGEQWLHYKREKTTKPIRIPLLPKAQFIIEKYKEHPVTLFPKISNQKLNSYLKEIADLCDIKKNLTFHIARHTFATTVTLSNGMPIETVSKLLGHSRISTTQIYAKVIERKVSEDMKALKRQLLNTSENKQSFKIK